jgi:hypothetical protein
MFEINRAYEQLCCHAAFRTSGPVTAVTVGETHRIGNSWFTTTIRGFDVKRFWLTRVEVRRGPFGYNKTMGGATSITVPRLE